MDVKDLAPWLIGATAHRALRDLLRAAIARRELPLLDGTTWVLRELAPVEAPTHKKRWTPAHLQELSEYRGTHGTKVAANHFKISASLVRRLLPGEKPQRQGYSVYTHRPK